MRISILIALSVSLAAAQETRREITSPANAADGKPNSEQVAPVYAVSTQFERVLVLRFKYETDLLAGIEQMVKQHKIRNAVILAGAGSVKSYHIHQVSNRVFPSKNMLVKDPAAAADIAGMNGYILNGKVHVHLTLANPDRAFGGHLEPGTNVFTFAIVTLGILPDDLDLSKLDDKNYR
jgi:predicted DNA-binding protein with PD1-like motif